MLMTVFKTEVDDFVIVIIGAAGDLSKRKLMPALAELAQQGWLPENYHIIATSRRPLTADMCKDLIENTAGDDEFKAGFLKRIVPLGEFDPSVGGKELARLLSTLPPKLRIFYAATPPSQFAAIAKALNENSLMGDDGVLVLEKPLGHDLASYLKIHEAVSCHIPEHQIYRIDHYLGKETVQNILCLRFANLLFESVWNSNYIDHIQITVAETIGAGERAGYYDNSGAIRDMLQNHLAQLVCLIAMEPPQRYDADCVRDEKLKVLNALMPVASEHVVRGQYSSGLVDGEKASAYCDELGNKSKTETFVALKTGIDNWRWASVPFYLRTGKRLPVRESQIVIRFKNVPHIIFPEGGRPYNQIVIRLQPNEGVELQINNKTPGPGGLRLESKTLNLNFNEPGEKMPDAYERLLLDALRQNPTLYMRHDEVKASWQWIEPALNSPNAEVEKYAAGTWGPDSSQILLANDGRRWFNPESES